MSSWVRAVLLAGALLAGVASAAPAPRVPDPAGQLLAMSGGVYRDAALARYLRAVGVRLVAAAGQPAAPWSFTVLDTPETNAFALPGRRIFVTRGMLALVGDEAELATVLGHEIGHSLAADGTTPGSARARRAAEVAADRTGLELLTSAGYDPGAQADFLTTLLASRALEARLRGSGHDPRGAPDHPALADRLEAARREAGAAAGAGVRNRAAYLAAIDGMTWGDGPAQGFVRGRSFVHPDLGFAFDIPPGYSGGEPARRGGGKRTGGCDAAHGQRRRPRRLARELPGAGLGARDRRRDPRGAAGVAAPGQAQRPRHGAGPAGDDLGRQRAGRGADRGPARGPSLPARPGCTCPATPPGRRCWRRRRGASGRSPGPRRPASRRSGSAFTASPAARTWRRSPRRCRSDRRRGRAST